MNKTIELTREKGRFNAIDESSQLFCKELFGTNKGIKFCQILNKNTTNEVCFIIDGTLVENV